MAVVACTCRAQVRILEQDGIKGERGFPHLHEHGPLPEEVEMGAGITHFMVISPVGEHLGEEHQDGVVLITMRDVANAVRGLAQLGLLQRWGASGDVIIGGMRATYGASAWIVAVHLSRCGSPIGDWPAYFSRQVGVVV